MEEKREAYANLEADVRVLKEGQERLINLLEGGLRPGFIEETRIQFGKINTWQAVHEDRRAQAESANRKMMALAGVAIAGITAVVHLIVDFIKGK